LHTDELERINHTVYDWEHLSPPKNNKFIIIWNKIVLYFLKDKVIFDILKIIPTIYKINKKNKIVLIEKYKIVE